MCIAQNPITDALVTAGLTAVTTVVQPTAAVAQSGNILIVICEFFYFSHKFLTS